MKINIKLLLPLLLIYPNLAWCGYAEINSVGDKSSSYHFNEAQSTETKSKVVSIISNQSIYDAIP